MNKNTVTPEEVKENMHDVIVRTVQEFEKPVTYVTVRMKNGFTLRECTTCVDPANYDENIGKEICLKKIESKVWELLGYTLQTGLATEPKDFKERMVAECKQLTQRIEKLEVFMKSDKFHQVESDMRQMMYDQLHGMKEYQGALTRRMIALGILTVHATID